MGAGANAVAAARPRRRAAGGHAQFLPYLLMRREVCAYDSRVVRVSITPRGRARFDDLLPVALRLCNRAVAGLTHARPDALVRDLQRILRNLDGPRRPSSSGR